MSNQNGHKQLPAAGRESKPEFTPVMMFDSVSCYRCNKGGTPDQPTMCRTPAELIFKAKASHDAIQDKTAIRKCEGDRLAIEYSTMLITTEYLEQLADETLII